MVNSKTNINVNLVIDIDTYNNASALCKFKGTTLEAALRDLIEHAAYDEYPEYKHIEPNEETIAAMQEMEDIIAGRIPAKSYSSVDELFADLDSEDDEDA